MSGYTSVTVGGIEVGVSSRYAVDSKSLSALSSLYKVEPRLAEMAGDHPHLTGWTPTEKSFSLTVFLLEPVLDDRRDAWADLAAVLAARYIPIAWTENSVTKTLYVVVGEGVVEPRYTEVAIACVAPDPIPV